MPVYLYIFTIPLNADLFAPISVRANNKIFCSEAHLSPRKIFELSELGKRRYSHTLGITYQKTTDN